MGYLKIPNLYKDQSILLFKECYALEKIHGTSAHVKATWSVDFLGFHFFAGGMDQTTFEQIFDICTLRGKFKLLMAEKGLTDLTIFGEAYGGKMQAMSATYGKEARFVAFDVKVGESWLDVPDAVLVCDALSIEFVHFVRIPTDLSAIDAQRDNYSVQAVRNGIEEDQIHEGVVLRPLHEVTKKNGARIIAKHKHPQFGEMRTNREVDLSKVDVLRDAQTVADEWVTEMRLQHVLDKIVPRPADVTRTGEVIRAVLEDVKVESSGIDGAPDEIVWSKDVERAVCTRAAQLFKRSVTQVVPK